MIQATEQDEKGKSFSRPNLRKAGVANRAIFAKFMAGESVTTLAILYDTPRAEIERAIRSGLFEQ